MGHIGYSALLNQMHEFVTFLNCQKLRNNFIRTVMRYYSHSNDFTILIKKLFHLSLLDEKAAIMLTKLT
jgi:hypothetical protein